MARNISASHVQKIADLARLSLSDAEREAAVSYLSDILAYADRLAVVPTEAVHPYVNAAAGISDLRPDQSREFGARSELLAGAELAEGLVVTRGVFTDRDSDHE